jgi:sulfite exporter TauE/SafE
VLCVGSMFLLVQSYAPDKAPYINCLELSSSQLASTFRSWFFLLLVRLNLGFILRKTCCCAHHTFLLGFPTGCLPCTIKHFSGAVAGEKEDFYKGSLSLPTFYFVIVLLTFFTLFLFASFYKKYKKISFFYSWYFVTSTFSS